MIEPPTNCPICKTRLSTAACELPRCFAFRCKCPACGEYRVAGTDVHSLLDDERMSPVQRAVLRHKVRRLNWSDRLPDLTEALIEEALGATRLPNPHEQGNDLILWLGDKCEAPGHFLEVPCEAAVGITGALSRDGYVFVMKHLKAANLIDAPDASVGGSRLRLTFSGWAAYEELRREAATSRRAFMAMPFGSERLNSAYRGCFRPACAQAGFDLMRLDERAPAGSIDDRLRVEIRRCRFLIADLTDANAGAYWEAGFAEGLGRPVIYTCEASHFSEHGTHFDTNHRQTVVWDEERLADAEAGLLATIRATLPSEAVMEDGNAQGANSDGPASS